MKTITIILGVLALSHKSTSVSDKATGEDFCEDAYPIECNVNWKNSCATNSRVRNEFCKKSCGTCGTSETNADCECGRSNDPKEAIVQQSSDPSKLRIVGGRVALKNKYPWLVSIIMRYNGRGNMCGGSIINTRYILSAGHCTYAGFCTNPYQAHDITVTVAEHNVGSINDDIRGVTERLTVKKIIRHEKWCIDPTSMTSYDNDIALFLLPKDIDLSHKELGLPCLPPTSWTRYEGETVTVAGWGLNQASGALAGTMATDLLEVTFKVFEDCRLYPYRHHITSNMICAGDHGAVKDSCGGDSGGPLVHKDQNNRYTQVGIVSFGPPGGNCTGIGVYTNVAHYIDWIRENTQDGECQI